MHRSLVLLLALASLWLVPDLASAQTGGSRLHLGAGIALDVGGEAEFNDVDYDLDATFGLRAHADWDVHRYISVGGLARMSWWEPDIYNADRSFLFDIGPRVLGHYDWRNFRFYGGLGIGLTLSALDEDFDNIDNPAFGWTMSLTVAGAEWWFARNVGLFAELGWVGHWFEHEAEVGRGELEIGLSQAMLEFGIVFGT